MLASLPCSVCFIKRMLLVFQTLRNPTTKTLRVETAPRHVYVVKNVVCCVFVLLSRCLPPHKRFYNKCAPGELTVIAVALATHCIDHIQILDVRAIY